MTDQTCKPLSSDRIRAEVGTQRRAPAKPIAVSIRYASNADLDDFGTHPGRLLREISLEATGPGGDLAEWFDDHWWGELISRWGKEDAIIRLEPTPDALLHPVVLHEVEMVYRVAPKWRTIGFAYTDDIRDKRDIETLASSHYNEVRIYDARRPYHAEHRADGGPFSVAQLIGLITRRQKDSGARRPALTRMPAPTQ